MCGAPTVIEGDTMYEPKYKLNRRDAKRWHDLLVRHCLEMPDKPGGKVKRHKKYPPLTPAENAEFEALTKKRDRKHAAHPAAKLALRRARRQSHKIEKLLAKLKKLTNKLKRKQVKIKVDGKR